VAKALQSLIATLQQHAPQSVSNLTATVSGGVSLQGGTFHAPVNISSGNTTNQSGGGAIVQGTVHTGGGAFVGRDQTINNITIHSVDQIQDLTAVIKSAMSQLTCEPGTRCVGCNVRRARRNFQALSVDRYRTDPLLESELR
jgi:hypothetical protein